VAAVNSAGAAIISAVQELNARHLVLAAAAMTGSCAASACSATDLNDLPTSMVSGSG
jgi:hypothetical protein